jgi:nucleoside 2-deoxyribosyltransferase
MNEGSKMNDTGIPQALLLTPYSEEFRSLRQLITEALEESGIESVLPEETLPDEMLRIGSALRAIIRSDLIIADLTGSNPDVMYEVGFAHAIKKPVLPIVQRREERVPSAIAGHLFLVYDPSQPDKLRDDIKFWANLYLSKEKRMHAHA